MTRGLTKAGSTKAWRRLRLAVLDRDGWTCRVPINAAGAIDPAGQHCGQPATTVDHITPRALGGQDDAGNLRAACEPHNRAKADRLDADAGVEPDRWRSWLDRPQAAVRRSAGQPARNWRW